MPSWGSFDFSDFAKWAKDIEKAVNEDAVQELMEQIVYELGNRLLRKTKQRTPVGNYEPVEGYEETRAGGALRKGWTLGEVIRQGDSVVVEVFNDVDYAPFVEFGHRQEVGRFVPAIGKRLKAHWVDGRYMLTISVKEIEAIAPKIIGQASDKFLKELLKL